MKRKKIVKIIQHYPTELVGLTGWSETIKAIKKRKVKNHVCKT